MKKSKSFFQKCELWMKALKQLYKDFQKAWEKYKNTKAKIFCLFVVAIMVCACNSVRATVKNGEGTTTTITVTTNNPSSTQVSPSTTTDLKIK